MKSYIHEIYNKSRPNMAAMKSVLHNLYFRVTLVAGFLLVSFFACLTLFGPDPFDL